MAVEPRRTGPIGRFARVVLAGVYVIPLLTLVGPGLSARFRNPHVLTEVSAWIVHLLMLLTFVILVGVLGSAVRGPGARRGWQVGAVVAVAVAFALAIFTTRVISGAWWGFPVADLLWWFDVVLLVQGVVASLLSSAIGLPGCEVGVWPWLVARAGGRSAVPEDGLACVVGLHMLDAWEAQRATQAV